MQSPKEIYYENLADSLIEQFSRRQIEGYYAKDKEEAKDIACRFLTPGCTVAWGGSATLSEIGLIDAIRSSDCVIYDRFAPETPEEKREMFGKIATADYYFMSSNAITLDGQLVNIDGHGNRVASLIHGPQNVIVIAGMNKVTADIDNAIKRVHHFAAPPNAARLNLKTQCAETGKCHNCLSPDCICDQIVITRRSFIPGRIKVILVGESLGF